MSAVSMNGGSSYTRVFRGKDVADLYANNRKAQDLFNEEAKQLLNDLVPLRRKFEKIPLWYLKDLSYTPE